MAAIAFACFLCRNWTRGSSKGSGAARHRLALRMTSSPSRRVWMQSAAEKSLAEHNACGPTVQGSQTSRPASICETVQPSEWSVETPTCEMRNKIQLAVSKMQSALQDELQEDELVIHGVLGQGAFGTVYHGVVSICSSSNWRLHFVHECNAARISENVRRRSASPCCSKNVPPTCTFPLRGRKLSLPKTHPDFVR